MVQRDQAFAFLGARVFNNHKSDGGVVFETWKNWFVWKSCHPKAMSTRTLLSAPGSRSAAKTALENNDAIAARTMDTRQKRGFMALLFSEEAALGKSKSRIKPGNGRSAHLLLQKATIRQRREGLVGNDRRPGVHLASDTRGPRSGVLVMDTDGVVVSMRETLVNDNGESLAISFNGSFDGLDYPVSGTPFAETVSYRLLTPNAIQGVAKKNGAVMVTETAVLSSDGKSIYVTYESFDRQGHPVRSHGLFERVDLR